MDKATTLRFQPSVFWDLLDPRIRDPNNQPTDNADPMRTDTAPDALMRVATHYVHPLIDGNDDQQTTSDYNTTLPSVESFEQFPMDELFAHFVPDDLAW